MFKYKEVDCPYFKTTCKGPGCAEWHKLAADWGECQANTKQADLAIDVEARKALYKKGFAAGMLAYSTNKNNVQYTGDGSTILVEAIENMEYLWSFAEREFS